MASLISLILSKRWRHWKKVVMCDAQLGLSDRSNSVKKYRPFFSPFKQPKCCLKMAALMLPFCYKRLLFRRKRTPVRTNVLFKTTNYSRKFGSTHQDTAYLTETAKWRRGNLELERVTDIYTIATNFECKLLSRPGRSVSSVWHHARCIVGKTKVFPGLKINTSQWLFLWPLATSACGWRGGLLDSLTNRD